MIYFPMITLEGCVGWNSLNSFPPNNWEVEKNNNFYLYLIFIENNKWRTHLIKEFNSVETFNIDENDINKITKSKSIKVFCLSKSKLPDSSITLPLMKFESTSIPTWRSSIGLKNDTNSSSYQGEIIPFSLKSNFLTFAPFIQDHNDNLQNFLVFTNLEKAPNKRKAHIDFTDIANPKKILKTCEVYNNTVNVINLNEIKYEPNSVPLISCNEMAGLPIFVSINNKTKGISLEHTHPGASFVVHGNRWVAQKQLKDIWFNKIYK